MWSKLIILGNLGDDPSLRYTPSGTPVCTLNIATNRTYKDANGNQVKEVTWIRASVFGKMAEACAQYLSKGRLALVEGRLTPDKTTGGPRIWTKTDGTPGANFEMFAEAVKFVGGNGGKRDEAGNEQGMPDTALPGNGEALPGTGPDEDTEIPF